MKTLRKCIYLIFGLFIFGLVSCANDSDNSSGSNKLLDMNGEEFRQGVYYYNDGFTKMYLVYALQMDGIKLLYAGTETERYPKEQENILKQSHIWENVHQYCSMIFYIEKDGDVDAIMLEKNESEESKWFYKQYHSTKRFKINGVIYSRLETNYGAEN